MLTHLSTHFYEPETVSWPDTNGEVGDMPDHAVTFSGGIQFNAGNIGQNPI